MKRIALLTVILFVLAIAGKAQTCPFGLAGTFRVGPTGNYPTLHAALADLHSKGLAGPVLLELQAGYSSSTETFPLAFNAVGCSKKGQEVTIRPQAGAGRLSITSASTTTTLDFNNGSYYILDGRPGGTDTSNLLLVANTSTSGNTVRFINGGSYNELTHLTAQGVTRSTGGGVIFFSGTDSVTGNAYNRIDSSSITAGASPPLFGIFASDFHVQLNKGNTINGCNIFNFVGDNVSTARGIYFQLGYDSVIVTNNSFYQTPDLNTPLNPSLTQNYTAIQVGSQYDGGHLISGNFIGGTAPKAGGVAMRLPLCHQFTGIQAGSATDPVMTSRVSNNTINNIIWPSTYGNVQLIQLGDLNGIPFNGACTGNILGDTSGAIGLTVTNSNIPATNVLQFTGIECAGDATSKPVTIEGNHIGGIGADAQSFGSFNAMYIYINGFLHGSYFIRNNIIGNDKQYNNIWWQGKGAAIGIALFGETFGPDTLVVTGNQIANIGSGSQFTISNNALGISYTGVSWGSSRIDSNSIHDLNIAVGQPGSAVAGIGVNINDVENLSTGNFSVTGNTVYSGAFGAMTAVAGNYSASGISIAYAGTRNDFHFTVSRNRIQGLYRSGGSVNLFEPVSGISVDTRSAGVSTIDNNMVQMQVSAGTTDVNQSYGLFGIFDQSGNNRYLYNSVYLRDEVPDIYPTGACFYSEQGDTTDAIVVMNNIFAGARAAVGDGLQLIVRPYKTRGFQSDYNLFYPMGPGGKSVAISDNNDSTLAQWQTAAGVDQHSKMADPLFVNPEGVGVDMNLHLQQGTPAESAGTVTYTTLTDIDGQLRASYTPVDIGADANNFNGAVTPPPPPPDTTKHDTTGTRPPVNTDTTALVRPFPNPFSGTLSMVLNAPTASVAQIGIYSISGTLIIALQATLLAGNNTIHVPMGNIPDGIYVIKVEIAGNHQTVQVMKKSG